MCDIVWHEKRNRLTLPLEQAQKQRNLYAKASPGLGLRLGMRKGSSAWMFLASCLESIPKNGIQTAGDCTSSTSIWHIKNLRTLRTSRKVTYETYQSLSSRNALIMRFAKQRYTPPICCHIYLCDQPGRPVKTSGTPAENRTIDISCRLHLASMLQNFATSRLRPQGVGIALDEIINGGNHQTMIHEMWGLSWCFPILFEYD